MARVVVIGAGVAGLAAAARLADFGHAVTVVEQAPQPGGQLATATADDLTFDLGPVTVEIPALLRDLFRKTGRPLERVLDLVPVDPAARYVFADGVVLDLPNASRARTREALSATLGPAAAEEWDTLIRRAGGLWELLRPRVLDAAFAAADARRLALRRDGRAASAPLTTLAGELHDPRLHDLLGSYAHALGVDPATAPAAVALLPYAEQTFGTWTVAGGPQRLVTALAERAVERGATLRLSASMTMIIVDGGRVAGVRLADDETLPAQIVVSTMPVAGLAASLPPGALRSAKRAQPQRSVLSVLLALDAPAPDPADIPARTILVGDHTHPRAVLHRMAAHPDGRTPAVLHVDTAPHDASLDWSDPGTTATAVHTALAACAARGLDLTARGRVVGVRTPYDLEHDLGAPGGRIYGTSWLGTGAITGRPGNETSIRGLYLAGAATHPGATLPLAVASAAIVADLISRP